MKKALFTVSLIVACFLAGAVGAQVAPTFTFLARSDLTTMTVPVLRPDTTDHRIALDLSPNGNPTEMTNHGYVWIDGCDKDLNTGPTAFHCFRAAITSTDARFGIMKFGTASTLPVKIISNSTVLATFSIGSNGHAKIVVDGVDILAELASLEARVP